MKYLSPLFIFIAGWILLLFTDNLSSICLTNGLLQLFLFALVVCLPAWRTGRMSYVDIGWPWGLTLIGVLTWFYGEGDIMRVAIVSIAYIFAGSRMGLGALKMWRMGYLKTEFPRYEYQKRPEYKAYQQTTNLWQAFEEEQRPILLIDEIDKADIEFPNDLLQELLNGKSDIIPLFGALLKNEQDVSLLEKLAFMSRRKG